MKKNKLISLLKNRSINDKNIEHIISKYTKKYQNVITEEGIFDLIAYMDNNKNDIMWSKIDELMPNVNYKLNLRIYKIYQNKISFEGIDKEIKTILVGDSSGKILLKLANQDIQKYSYLKEKDNIRIYNVSLYKEDAKKYIYLNENGYIEITNEYDFLDREKIVNINNNIKYVNIRATILSFNKIYMYNACPICKKKVINNNNKFFCNTCKTRVLPNKSILLEIIVDDCSDNICCILFNENVEYLLNEKIDVIEKILKKYNNLDMNYNDILMKYLLEEKSEILGTEICIYAKVIPENMIKLNVIKIFPIMYDKEIKKLINRLENIFNE